MFVLVLLPIILLGPIIYWYYLYLVKYRDLRKLSGPTPLPVVGNWIPNDSVGIMKSMQELYDKYKPRFVFYTGFQVRVFHSDAEHINYILNSSQHINKSDNFEVLKGWIGDGIACSRGDKWRQRRRIINQSLGMNLMEGFVRVFNKVNDVLLDKMAIAAGKGPVDLLDFTNYSALDIALETLMGTTLNTQENRNHSYIENAKEILRIVGVRFFSFFFRNESIFLMFSQQKQEYLKYATDLKQFTEEVIEGKIKEFKVEDNHSEKENEFGMKKKVTLMDIMLSEYQNGNIDYEGVREEIDTFMVAGHETSAGLLAFVLLELARNPEVQSNLYDEIMSIAPTGDFTMDHLSNMTYLEMVVKETLRLYPQVPYMERQILDEFEMDGIKYPVGTVFGIPIINMHMDSDYFPDPYKFDPLRFSPENVDKIPKYAYLPFSAGPRICIGYKYAMWSAKCAVAKCVREYVFHPEPGFEIELEFQITLKSTTGIRCSYKKRRPD